MRNSKKQIRTSLIAFAALASTGCVSSLPSFSHVHVGHAFTGWVNTPGQKGLFITSESFARQIARNSNEALSMVRKGSLEQAKSKASSIVDLVGNLDDTVEGKSDYRFLSAFQEARNHIGYAIQSADATGNMKSGLERFQTDSEIIVARADLIKTFAQEIDTVSDLSEAEDLARELRILAVQNLEGEDVNGSGAIGDSPDEFGLRQLRDDVSKVLAAENPKYRPVEQRYLFGLVRLPDGTWRFRDSDSSSGYSRGGY
ncbi:MAG: hypothetical protein KTR18_14855 [Acidiferrobacterales bacterium]|nr:hypothetical protein [Acidiferrobacterales bacterium]